MSFSGKKMTFRNCKKQACDFVRHWRALRGIHDRRDAPETGHNANARLIMVRKYAIYRQKAFI
ncbi:MAG: hypothetical protein ABR561_02595 [Guyparkeria sp.]